MGDIDQDLVKQAIALHGSVQKVSELFQVDRSIIFRKIQKK